MQLNDANTSPQTGNRRLLQFRLKTLLLVPLLLGLFQTFSDQPFDHFFYLMLGYGAIFGTLWAVGSARLLESARQGTLRIVRLAGAAALGGLVSGMLAGGPALAISLWRSEPDWGWYWWHPKITWQDKAIEGATIAIGGIWLGGVLATLGGLLVGVPIAYLSLNRKGRSARPLLAVESIELKAVTTAESPGWRFVRGSLILLSASLMFGPTLWIFYRLARRHADARAISSLQDAGIEVFSAERYNGPQWVETLLSGYGFEDYLERVQYLSVRGVLDNRAWRQIEVFRDLKHLSVHLDGITDEQLSEFARRLDRTHAQYFGLGLSQSPISDAGLRHLSGLKRLVDIDLQQTRITDEGLLHLAGLPNLSWLMVRDTEVTPQGIAKLRSRSRAAFQVH